MPTARRPPAITPNAANPAEVFDAPRSLRLGDRLIMKGLVTADQLAVALRRQKATPQMLGHTLVQLGFVSEPDLIEVLAEASGFERLHLHQTIIDPALVQMVPRTLAEMARAIPVSFADGIVTLAMVDPLDLPMLDRVRRCFPDDWQVEPAVVSASELENAIKLYYGAAASDVIASDAASVGAVRLINAVIEEAVHLGASDLHFEPEELFVRLRTRIDGRLGEVRTFHKDDWPSLNVRLKIMAGMNIAEARRPQDGRFSLYISGREVDFRVASHPTVHGENIVVRILDKARSLVPLDQLGYTPQMVERLKILLRRPEGIVIVTGPTGSGKTTTLYSIMGYLNAAHVNIMTLEEPVEYRLGLIRQSDAKETHGMGFAEGIRSILRQDPDIVLVGEVRDTATAQMALRSAMTGHQVFTTLHTNDALGAVGRLTDLGLHQAMLAGNIICVMAQRLVRKLCLSCRTHRPATAEEQRVLGRPPGVVPLVYHADGCTECRQTGFRGRIAVAEILAFTRELDELVATGATRGSIRVAAEAQGFVGMAEDGITKVLAGDTSLEELMGSVDMTERLLQ